MKKVLKSLLLVFVVVSFSLSSFFATPVYAADGCSMSFTGSGGVYPTSVTVSSSDVVIEGNTESVYLEIDGVEPFNNGNDSNVARMELGTQVKVNRSFGPVDITEKLKEELSDTSYFPKGRPITVTVALYSRAGLSSYKICQNEVIFSLEADTSKASAALSGLVCKDTNNQFRVSFSGSYKGLTPNSLYHVKQNVHVGYIGYDQLPFTTSSSGEGSFQVGKYLEETVYTEGYFQNYCVVDGSIYEVDPCAFAITSVDLAFNPNVPSCDEVGEFPEVPDSDQRNQPFYLCQQAGSEQVVAGSECMECLENEGIWTAVGCIPYANVTGMIRAFINLGLGIGGGVVVLMVLAGGFVLSTSQGDPKRVEEAKAMISSAVMGLVFVIFSITILRFIGVSVLQLPGFGS